MEEFSRIQRLPPYVFNITGEMKISARRRGEDIIDFGMGNPDGATPKFIVDKLIEASQRTTTHRGLRRRDGASRSRPAAAVAGAPVAAPSAAVLVWESEGGAPAERLAG